jgi:hypothetical protein
MVFTERMKPSRMRERDAPAVGGPKPLSATFRSGRSQVVSAGDGRNADRLKSIPRIAARSRSKTQMWAKKVPQGTRAVPRASSPVAKT